MAELSAARSRRGRPTDLASFEQDVRAALAAFTNDVSYAVEMARAAVTIATKRQVWETRKELRAAEKTAHDECRKHEFTCHAVSACGTGDCKFAQDDHATITVTARPGARHRPQAPYTAYSLEDAVEALVATRKV